MEKEQVYYSISQINEYIKVLFDNTATLKNIYLKGEISNYKGRNKSGHIYFTLKDEKCSINAVLFKYDTFSLNFEPKNGDEVLVCGSISSYPPSGTYQIICKNISLFGVGDSYLKKELLKKKLFQEGIFNIEHKKKIPSYPKNIGIITGKNSAAALDFEFNLKRRFPLVEVTIIPSLVQGENAVEDLIKNLNAADNKYDLLIIGRGGGASEDLSAFDDERLVRCIYNLNSSIISAVGHEINQTLCDLVADKFASTPTGAAEIAVPNIEDILFDLTQIKNYLDSLINGKISTLENKLLRIKSIKYFQNMESIYDSYNNKLISLKQLLNVKIENLLSKAEKKLDYQKRSLELLNPNNILNKGYSIVTNQNGKVVNSVSQVNKDDLLNIKLSNGRVISKVVSKEDEYAK